MFGASTWVTLKKSFEKTRKRVNISSHIVKGVVRNRLKAVNVIDSDEEARRKGALSLEKQNCHFRISNQQGTKLTASSPFRHGKKIEISCLF